VLTEWRNRFVGAFLTEFQATPDRTAHWLTQVVGPNPNKILFMADDPRGQTFGYLGLDFIDWPRRYGEADAIVRGREAPAGTMKRALQTLLGWARQTLGLLELGVRVRSDNPALAFYRRVGFIDLKQVPLRCVRAPQAVVWVPDESVTSPEVKLVHLRWHAA
jgi:hypothetical protein